MTARPPTRSASRPLTARGGLHKLTLTAFGGVVALASLGCGGRTSTRADEPVDAGEDPEPEPEPELLTESDKLDVLFVIDNTAPATFAHQALTKTLPYLIDRLLEPRCVNGLGQLVDAPIMGATCAVGKRDFAPLRDIHIGVISTSLGGRGADTCSPASPSFRPEQDDGARLLSRAAGSGQVPTYDGLGFLVWDPDQNADPPGDSDRDGFEAKLVEIVNGVGGRGCGFEAPLEAFYRFLIEPSPYERITVVNDVAVPSGVDQVLLEQRAAFLRPDSAVLVVLITDEDDCSILDGGGNYFVAQASAGGGLFHLPRPRSECATAPDDRCCVSCGAATPAGCPEDPTCALGPLSAAEDPINLRCFDQKRRFGIDFLYPIERYVEGLTAPRVATYDGSEAENPLFRERRSPSMITIAAITGVPWQDIAISSQSPGAGYVPTAELDWDRVLGDGTGPPGDPLMLPSRTPRTGTHPVTGEALAPPDAPSPNANTINGHEHLLDAELQYACIYPLAQALLCEDDTCECAPATQLGNPVCQNDDGSYGAIQRFGRATPGTRQLRLLQALPTTSALASICTTDDFNPSSPAFAFKPAVDTILRTLRRSLVKPIE